MADFALIGKKLTHSYSKIIHNKLGYNYDIVEVQPENLREFVLNGKYKGYNVTIPYKTEIIKYLDKLDETAKLINAVNTVVERHGKLIGYNTDILGLEYLISSSQLLNKEVMILGDGGAGKMALYHAKKSNAKSVTVVSLFTDINYETCYDFVKTQVIINTTPVGMYPDNYASPIDLSKFPKLEFVVDVIYNPLKTQLILQAESLNIKAVGGLKMLVAQAKFSSDLFFNTIKPNDLIESIYSEIYLDTRNIVLIGMPSCGKSTIGIALNKMLNRWFIDSDEEIVKEYNLSIPEIFENYGESGFRSRESQVILEISKTVGAVIATGGGAVLKPQNVSALKQNGVLIFIDRNVDKLETINRPLSRDIDALREMEKARRPIYQQVCDICVKNDDINMCIKDIIDYIKSGN